MREQIDEVVAAAGEDIHGSDNIPEEDLQEDAEEHRKDSQTHTQAVAAEEDSPRILGKELPEEAVGDIRHKDSHLREDACHRVLRAELEGAADKDCLREDSCHIEDHQEQLKVTKTDLEHSQEHHPSWNVLHREEKRA